MRGQTKLKNRRSARSTDKRLGRLGKNHSKERRGQIRTDPKKNCWFNDAWIVSLRGTVPDASGGG